AQAARSLYKMSPEQRSRAEKYRSYKEKVVLFARQAFLPEQWPLRVSEKSPVLIETKAFFSSRVHPDPENCRKCFGDALFPGSTGGDKYTAGMFWPPLYDKANPRVEVKICFSAG